MLKKIDYYVIRILIYITILSNKMSISQEQLWKSIGDLGRELYHSGKNYVASIVGGKNGTYDDYYYSVKNIFPMDKNKDKILNLATIMINLMEDKEEPLYLAGGGEGFECSIFHKSGDIYYSEYIFTAKHDKPYICPEELICKKYQIDPTPENQKKLKLSIMERVRSYKKRDLEKSKRIVTFEEAEKLDDYFLNILFFDIYKKDEDLQKLSHLEGKKVSELLPEQRIDVSKYITKTNCPVLLLKEFGDSKLLVNEIPVFQTSSYMDLCHILIHNSEECKYCKCKMTLLNSQYVESALTFDAIVPLFGHRKDNITLCCFMCNSKKTFKNTLDI
jgi:hypothetical protein